MQNTAFTPPPNPLLPPSGQDQQRGVQGNGGQHHQPSSLFSNGPPPLLSRPHQQNTPPAPTLQTGRGSQGPQGVGESQDHQGRSHVDSDPELTIARRPYRRRGMPVQVPQVPSLPFAQPQWLDLVRHPAPAPHHGPANGQYIPQFTTHPLPAGAEPFSPHDWTSVQAGLHLTGLRSPRRTTSSPGPGAQKHLSRYYQFFSRFAAEPREIPLQMGVTVIELDITQEEAGRLSITRRPPPSPLDDPFITQLPVSRHFQNSLRYRLRMCVSRKQEGTMSFDAAKWTRGATYWPPHIFVSVNDEIIQVRRKQHFHRDLPLELTESLSEGKNQIKVNLPPFPQNLQQDVVYFMAVERVVTLDRSTVWDMVTSGPHVKAEVTKKEIRRRLSPLDTDEIIIESDTLTVSVADLFSSTLFNTPVRGRNCLHLECFDLGNWLISRPSKPSLSPGEPTAVDCWGCPICGSDARPCSLQVDDFFVNVTKKLMASGKMKVKKIEVHADGSWTAIEEGDEGEEGEELSDSESWKVDTFNEQCF
ncbi:hypothetical protein TgHK011_005796 [Trichoderma gracile]|nr:hypothetical protein TgHK011_005796 [Trichoderma gracile]